MSSKVCFKCGIKYRYKTSSYCKECAFELAKMYKRSIKKPFDQVLILENEQWLPIVGFENIYTISNLGRLKSLERIGSSGHLLREKIMKQQLSKFGYNRAALFNGHTYNIKSIHRLVAEAFIQNIGNRPDVNHIDGNKVNNLKTNLEWVSKSENSQHALKLGLIPQIGEKGFFAKLTNKEASEIYISSLSAKELSTVYNVCEGTINKIRGNHQWREVTKNLNKSSVWRTGLKKLAYEQVLDIFNSKTSLRETAKQYDISYPTVSSIRNGKTWTHITGKKYKAT